MAELSLWPVSIPCPLYDGAAYTPQQNLIRSSMDGGAKHRRRFTSVPSDCTFTLRLTEAQVQTLDDFVAVTLKDVLPFKWKDFRRPDGPTNVVVYRFKSRPSYTPVGPGYWDAAIELEMLTELQGRFLTEIADITTA